MCEAAREEEEAGNCICPARRRVVAATRGCVEVPCAARCCVDARCTAARGCVEAACTAMWLCGGCLYSSTGMCGARCTADSGAMRQQMQVHSSTWLCRGCPIYPRLDINAEGEGEREGRAAWEETATADEEQNLRDYPVRHQELTLQWLSCNAQFFKRKQ